ncbi:hypothetical protein SKAU_G00363340 [Synaphobranchus kaupii]|uniref:Uncharacterized protein n=1 Tax=Synaphobranchus kaupii TaxID=118154 RepID=A0A9Q1EIQ6_SYNKA|nr:hypothetical protein SKAU_G00363340 [Synaphobranchus kaupii]
MQRNVRTNKRSVQRAQKAPDESGGFRRMPSTSARNDERLSALGPRYRRFLAPLNKTAVEKLLSQPTVAPHAHITQRGPACTLPKLRGAVSFATKTSSLNQPDSSSAVEDGSRGEVGAVTALSSRLKAPPARSRIVSEYRFPYPLLTSRQQAVPNAAELNCVTPAVVHAAK